METRLKAATATISARDEKEHALLDLHRLNHWRLVRVQSLTDQAGGSSPANRQPTSPARSRGRPGAVAGRSGRKGPAACARVVQAHQRHGAIVLVVAGLEGGGHGEQQQARRAARAPGIRQHQRDAGPASPPACAPARCPAPPGWRRVAAATPRRAGARPDPDTFGLGLDVDAAQQRWLHCRPRPSSACGDEGASAVTSGWRCSSAAVARQSGNAWPLASATCTCAITESMRSRTSFWNPFITDSTTISAATPTRWRASSR